MDFENVLSKIGDFGRYQKLLLLLLSFVLLFNTSHLYVQVFSAGKNDHWCKAWETEDCPDESIDCESLKKNLSIPHRQLEDGSIEYEKCLKYNVTGIDLKDAIEYAENISSLEEIPCDEGWNFDRSTFPSTIVIDFELVCGKSHLPNIGQSTFFAGYLIGAGLGGLAADLFGRRTILLSGILSSCLVSTSIIFIPNMALYITIRFFVGVFTRLLATSNFVLLLEMVSPSKRILVTNVYFLAFALGYFFLTGLAKLIHNWRILQLVLTAPYFIFFIMAYFFVLESPRWLLTKGRTEKARSAITKIARMNGREDVRDEDLNITPENEGSQPNEMVRNLRELVRSPLLVFIAVNMCFNWAVQSLVFYGLSLSTSSLGIDPYLSFVVSGAVEIPAYFSCMFFAELLGRKGSVFTTMMLGGMCCCASTFVPAGLSRALVATGGKFFISMSFSIVCTWSAELVPTSLRTTGAGLFSMSSRLGGIPAPLILLLEDVCSSLPYIIFGSFSVFAGLLCLLIPETKAKPLPTTMEDVKSLSRKRKQKDGDGENEDREKDNELFPLGESNPRQVIT